MKKYLIARHFINSRQTLDELVDSIKRLHIAQELTQSRGIDLGLKLTVDHKKLDSDLLEEVRHTTNLLPNFWFLYDPKDRGPGTSFRQILFNPTFSDGIVANADLDQYVIDTKEALEQIDSMFERMQKENSLYANGSRDVPVVLATNKRNSDLRAIHELFHSLTIGSDKLRLPPRKNTSPSYASIGESTSGFYFINQTNYAFPELSQKLFRAVQNADFSGFATDYFTAINSSRIGRINSGYLRSNENKFYQKVDEEKELGSVKRLISYSTEQLAKTVLRNILLSNLNNPKNVDILRDFYPTEDVLFVKDLMYNAIISQK